ncbi:kinase-associated lipoprotein B [Alteribacter natronophilus]|uniref:kinase-associated lipoprotein B n=1 Tax=Alteribacter natronophilus TaxID=2583810 RepID=UPI00110E7BEC|nr:kinase-associated lipoprotein B [Alteribacter natronophilus]TMW73393.1 kinase [Alteribacter natronophilus]
MTDSNYAPGTVVTGVYKTGKYIGEITDIKKDRYVVKVMAVLKHPKQGDLHSPKQTDVPLFHERRALGEREKTNVPASLVKPYEGTVPDYRSSLKEALEKEKAALQNDQSDWAKMALDRINNLEEDYFS